MDSTHIATVIIGAGQAGLPLDVANVVWATGFRQTFDWIRLPLLGADGWPDEMRGVVESAPGLFFCGSSSSTPSADGAPGIGRDAAYLADRIVRMAEPVGRTLGQGGSHDGRGGRARTRSGDLRAR